jgi:hypothetical protein
MLVLKNVDRPVGILGFEGGDDDWKSVAIVWNISDGRFEYRQSDAAPLKLGRPSLYSNGARPRHWLCRLRYHVQLKCTI